LVAENGHAYFLGVSPAKKRFASYENRPNHFRDEFKSMSALKVNRDQILAAQSGDVQALNEILACSRQDLRRYAEHHCVVNDVEDAVQETLFMASRRLGDLRSVESFTSWLFRIVKHECNRMRRGWRMLTNQEIGEEIMPGVTPEPMAWRLDLGRMLAALPPQYRAILLLRDVEGLSLEELSEQLNLSLAGTKSRLHRARMLARERLSSPEAANAEGASNAVEDEL
jgi:RNA polymerase sigma factor (sigma-70 family)